MDLSFAVEVALGADLTDLTGASWTWTDITRYVRGDIQISRGRPSLGQGQPAQCRFRLNNLDGRFTPWHPSSVYYGQWQRGTPIRVRVDPGAGMAVRFQGALAVVPLSWPSGNSTQAEAAITAAGSLRRLSQGVVLRAPLPRAAHRVAPVAAWPLDDNSGSTQLASSISGGAPLTVVNSGVQIGATDSDLPGAAGVITLAAGVLPLVNNGQVAGTVSYTNAGYVAIRVWLKVAGGTGTVIATETVAWTMAGSGTLTHGTISLWGPGAPPGGVQMSFIGTGAWAPPLTVTGPPGVPIVPTDGEWHEVFVTLQQSGSDTAVNVYIDGQLGTTSTLTGETLNPIKTIWINGYVAGSLDSQVSAAMLAIYTNPAAAPLYGAGGGWSGELAGARVARLCAEEGVPVTVTGTSNIAMGPQPQGTFVNLLRECETADQGILRDGWTAGITYLAGAARYNGTVAMALDVNRRHAKLPLEPIEDDSRTRNDVTASRNGGSSARYVDNSSTNPLSTVKIGVYDDQITVNVADARLLDQAAWRVHLGTIPEMRVPTLAIMPSDTPEIITPWLACDLGARYTLSHTPDQHPGDLDQVLEYYVETFDAVSWRVQLTGSPASAWRVLELDLDRLEFNGQNLASGVSATATSWSVASPVLPLMVTTALVPGDFPYYAQCEGEVVRVTATSGTSSPQTVTVVRSINGISKTHAAGALLLLWPSTPMAL